MQYFNHSTSIKMLFFVAPFITGAAFFRPVNAADEPSVFDKLSRPGGPSWFIRNISDFMAYEIFSNAADEFAL